MTFTSAVKKSGTVSKPGSKTLLPGSPRSPGSPLNVPAKLITGSSIKAPLVSNAEKINGTNVKKSLVPPKSPVVKSVTKLVIDAKSESEKKAAPAVKGAMKTAIKPPPLKLNIKGADAKGLKSPVTPKLAPKTPTTPSVKSPMLAKSPLVTKTSLAAKSPIMSIGVVKSPSSPNTKSSQASTVPSLVTKPPQIIAGTKSSTSAVRKTSTSTLAVSKTSNSTSAVSKTPTSPSAVSKTPTSPSTVSKTLTSTSAVSKTSTLVLKSVVSKAIVKVNSTSSKPVPSKDQTTVLKPTTPLKKTAVLSTKTVTNVKLPTSPTMKSSMTRSPSTASSVKSISLKTQSSPSKSLTKETSPAKISTIKSTITKANVISKTGPTSPKMMVKKEPSTLSLLSVKSTTSIKSTILSKSTSTTLKAKVTPPLDSKSLAPKSPVAKAPVTRTIKTPLSPAVKTRTSSISSIKSPTVNKLVPTKLLLSPSLPKSKSLSSSRLSSVSTESLASRTSLKSPMSPKPTKVITKNSSKAIEIEKPIVKSIRGGQSIKKKTIDIPGITELPSIPVETIESPCILENVFNKDDEFPISQVPHQDSQDSEKLVSHKNIVGIDNSSEILNNIVNEDLCNSVNTQNVDQSSEVKELNLETIEEDLIEQSSIKLSEEQNQDEDICKSFDFVVVNKDECIPQLKSISRSSNNCGIAFDDNHFVTLTENNIVEQVDEAQSCIIDMDEHFEPMNDKLVLGDVPFETDSSQDDISDNEQKEIFNTEDFNLPQMDCVDDVFLFNDFDSADSTDNFTQQFMPKSIKKMSEGSSSISTDDGSSLSRKSYSEAVSGSFKDCEYYFDYDFDVVDDCLDDDEGKSVFVEVTEKEFPELKQKGISLKRRNKKQKKRISSYRTESQSGTNNLLLMIVKCLLIIYYF